MRHLMSPLDMTVEELDKLMTLADNIQLHPEQYAHVCEGRILATCFYEPSTRSRLSFESAMMHLGGKASMGVDQQIMSTMYIGVMKNGEPVVVGKAK